MCETDLIRIDLHDARACGPTNVVCNEVRSLRRSGDHRQRRIGKGRYCQQDLLGPAREQAEAPLHQLAKALGKSYRADPVLHSVLENVAADLERIERIASRRLMDLDQHRPGQFSPKARTYYVMQRAEAQGWQRQLRKVIACQSPLESQGDSAVLTRPLRDQNTDRLGLETANDELQNPRRRGVEPLRVVDGDQGRAQR